MTINYQTNHHNFHRVRSSLPFRNNFTISCDNRRIKYYLAKRLYATISRSMVRSVLSQLNIVSYYSKRYTDNTLYIKRLYVTVSPDEAKLTGVFIKPIDTKYVYNSKVKPIFIKFQLLEHPRGFCCS